MATLTDELAEWFARDPGGIGELLSGPLDLVIDEDYTINGRRRSLAEVQAAARQLLADGRATITLRVCGPAGARVVDVWLEAPTAHKAAA